MPPFVETILFVFILIVLGYAAVALGLLRAETGDGLTDFVFKVAVPLLLFRTLIAADIDALPWSLWITYFGAVAVTWTAGHLTIRRIFGRDARAGVVSGVTAAFSNLVLVGIPLIAGVYGPEGLLVLSLVVSVHLVIMMAASIILFEWAVRRDGVVTGSPGVAKLVTRFFSQLLRNPLIVGIAAGLTGQALGVTLPALAARTVDSMAGVAAPVALFAMGMSLRRFGLAGNVRPAIALAGLKLLLMPAVTLGLAILLDLPPLTAQVAVIAASLPAGVNAWLIAAHFNTGQRLASTAMTLATAAAAVTTLGWAYLASAVFG